MSIDFTLKPVDDKKVRRPRKQRKKKVQEENVSQSKLVEQVEGPITREELGSWLWGAADILRGAVSADDYGDFVLPLMFYKRLSDNYSFEYQQKLAKYGEERVAKDAMFYRAVVPDGCLWEDVRKTATNVGAKLNDVLNSIAKANPKLDRVRARAQYFFGKTEDYLNLFLYLYSLQTGQPWIKFQNVGYTIASYTQLGTIDPGFPGFQHIEYMGDPLERHIEYLQKLTRLFHQLETDYENIMKSPSGLSLKFFHDAIMSNHRKELDLAVVHFIIAAEALTIVGEESKRQNVSKRIAVLTSESSTEYSEICRKMKDLYDVRSGIVHGGGKKATPVHVGDLFCYLRKAVLIRLSLRHLSKRELVSKLDAISVDWNKKQDLTSMQAFEFKARKIDTPSRNF